MKYPGLTRPTPTPQSRPLTAAQVANSAGGFVFTLDKWARLDRFLILGSDAPTYYQSARALTLENAKVLGECYAEDAGRTVERIVEISLSGRAPKNDPAIFALAYALTMPEELTRQRALRSLGAVCRTSTHLFAFVNAARALGHGWGRALKNAVGGWYTNRSIASVSYQAIKYRQREGYDHARLLNLSHAPASASPMRQNLYRWIKGKPFERDHLVYQVQAHLTAMASEDPKVWAQLAGDERLPWEALPTAANTHPEVWQAMLPHLGLTALIRNLGNMTRVGAIAPLSAGEAAVVARLESVEDLRAARIHPYTILQAIAVYGSGRGFRGSGLWTPSQPVMAALDKAFYAAFANVVPTGKRHMLALDVSASMTTPFGGGVLTCRDATAALALITQSVEAMTFIVGFHSGHGLPRGGLAGIAPVPIRKGMSLPEVLRVTSSLPFGGTDCSLPMLYASALKLPVDTFVVLTDNETWAGHMHPAEALRQYRAQMGIDAKMVVVGMTSTGFSIADPNDAGMLDVVGFDANCPALIADFARDPETRTVGLQTEEVD